MMILGTLAGWGGGQNIYTLQLGDGEAALGLIHILMQG